VLVSTDGFPHNIQRERPIIRPIFPSSRHIFFKSPQMSRKEIKTYIFDADKEIGITKETPFYDSSFL
jgi:hypothetical protein